MRGMKVIEKLANVGVADAIRIKALPERYRRWESTQRLPGIKPTIQNFVKNFMLKIYPVNALYAKASCNEDLLPNEIEVPKQIIERCWCVTVGLDYTHCIVKRNKKFKLITRDELKDDDTPIVFIRKPMEDDMTLVIRHPVKEMHCMVATKLKVTNKESDLVYVNNDLIEKLEGDFDGDSLLILFFSPELLEPEEIPTTKEKKIEIPNPGKVDVDTFWKPKTLSKLLKFKSPANYVSAVVLYLTGEQIDPDMIRDFIKRKSLGKLLYFICSAKVMEKAMKYKDITGIEIIKDLWPESPLASIDISDFQKRDNIDYSEEITLGLELEKLFRLYFRSWGPKLSGYVQKVLLDVSTVILESEELQKVFTEKELEMIKNLEFLKLIDRLQQSVIDLKHRHNSLCFLDTAFQLESIVKRTSLKPDEIYNIVKQVIDDEELIILCTKMFVIANAQRHRYLTWSYGIVGKLLDGELLETWITSPITKLNK